MNSFTSLSIDKKYLFHLLKSCWQLALLQVEIYYTLSNREHAVEVDGVVADAHTTILVRGFPVTCN